MVAHNAQKKSTALAKAKRLRKRGNEVSVYKKKKGYGISSTK